VSKQSGGGGNRTAATIDGKLVKRFSERRRMRRNWTAGSTFRYRFVGRDRRVAGTARADQDRHLGAGPRGQVTGAEVLWGNRRNGPQRLGNLNHAPCPFVKPEGDLCGLNLF